MITYYCPRCHERLTVHESKAGTAFVCNLCGASTLVPSSDPTPSEAAPESGSPQGEGGLRPSGAAGRRRPLLLVGLLGLVFVGIVVTGLSVRHASNARKLAEQQAAEAARLHAELEAQRRQSGGLRQQQAAETARLRAEAEAQRRQAEGLRQQQAAETTRVAQQGQQQEYQSQEAYAQGVADAQQRQRATEDQEQLARDEQAVESLIKRRVADLDRVQSYYKELYKKSGVMHGQAATGADWAQSMSAPIIAGNLQNGPLEWLRAHGRETVLCGVSRGPLGHEYHQAGCRFLTGNERPRLRGAIDMFSGASGYALPCQTCFPRGR